MTLRYKNPETGIKMSLSDEGDLACIIKGEIETTFTIWPWGQNEGGLIKATRIYWRNREKRDIMRILKKEVPIRAGQKKTICGTLFRGS